MARAVEERRRHRRRPKQRQEEAMREHGILAKKMNVIVSKDKITEKDPKTGYFSVVRKVTERPVVFLPHPPKTRQLWIVYIGEGYAIMPVTSTLITYLPLQPWV